MAVIPRATRRRREPRGVHVERGSRALKPRCARVEAEKHSAGEFVVVGRQPNVQDSDVDIAEASIDTPAFVDGAAARCGVNEVDRTHRRFASEGASHPDGGSLRQRRRLACCDFCPLLFNGLDQKRTAARNIDSARPTSAWVDDLSRSSAVDPMAVFPPASSTKESMAARAMPSVTAA